MNGRGGARQMVDAIDLQQNRLDDIVTNQSKRGSHQVEIFTRLPL